MGVKEAVRGENEEGRGRQPGSGQTAGVREAEQRETGRLKAIRWVNGVFGTRTAPWRMRMGVLTGPQLPAQ